LKFKNKERFTAYMQDEQPLKPATYFEYCGDESRKTAVNTPNPQSKTTLTSAGQGTDGRRACVVDTRDHPPPLAQVISPARSMYRYPAAEFEQRVGWMVEDETKIIL
jgi:hypothetical protein